MKEWLSFLVHPTNDHVGAGHLSVGRESEANPAFRADTHGKGNGLRIEVVAPEELVVLVQSGREGVPYREVMDTGAGPRVQQ